MTLVAAQGEVSGLWCQVAVVWLRACFECPLGDAPMVTIQTLDRSTPGATGLYSRVVCGMVGLVLQPYSRRQPPTSHPSRPYPTHHRFRPESARLQALASDFWPVLGGSIVRTGENLDRKVWASGWWCQRW